MNLKLIYLMLVCSLFLLGCHSSINTCEDNNRHVLIDSSYSNGKINAILASLDAWREQTDNLFTFDVEVVDKPVTAQCTYIILNEHQSHLEGEGFIASGIGYNNEIGPGTARGIAWVKEGLIPIPGTEPATDAEFELVAIHEIGHVLGLGHLIYSDHRSIMEPNYNPENILTLEEGAKVIERWHEIGEDSKNYPNPLEYY